MLRPTPGDPWGVEQPFLTHPNLYQTFTHLSLSQQAIPNLTLQIPTLPHYPMGKMDGWMS